MKLSSKLKTVALASVFTCLISGIAYAGDLQVSVYKNVRDGKVTVESITGAGEIVAIHVLPENITPSQVEENPELGKMSAYYRNEVADENGKTEVTFYLDEGSYVLYMANSAAKGELYSEKLIFVDEETYAEIIKRLKSEDKDGFLQTVEENKGILGFDTENYSKDAVLRFFSEYKNKLEEADYEENLKNFRKCALIEAVNASEDIDVVKQVKEIYFEDSELLGFIDKYIKTEEQADFYEARLKSTSDNNIKDSDELDDFVKEAVVLTVVKYPVKDKNIEDVLKAYKDILGLDEVTSYASVYRELSGNTYNTASELVKAYEKADSSGNESSGGSSGSGSGGNKKVNPSNVSSAPIQLPSTAGQMADVDIFEDLANVSWAVDSIEGLYKKGIVNGRENQKFYPGENVLREEFVKMVVLTFGLKLTGQEMPFSDVQKDAWFYDYVRIAYDAEIVTGIGDELFGTGLSITRQDICVMIYRALEKCAVSLPKNKEAVVFNDSENIAGYAKEAVSCLQQAGIINGTDTGDFNPANPATRAETAKILYGVLKLIGRG